MVEVGAGGRSAPDPDIARVGALGVGMFLLFLLLSFASLADAASAGRLGGGQLVAVFALKLGICAAQLVHSLPALRPLRRRWWPWTFAAQAALSFLPHLAFGGDWASGGLLAGSALLLFGPPVSWLVCGLILVAETVLLAWYTGDPHLVAADMVYGALVYALAVYGLTRLMDVIGALAATRAATARAALDEERVRAARQVYGVIGSRIGDIARSAEQARAAIGGEPERAGPAVAALAATAREVLAEVRGAAQRFRAAPADPPDRYAATRRRTAREPRIAFVIVVVMSLAVGSSILDIIAHDSRHSTPTVLAAAVGLAALAALTGYHSAPRPDPTAVPARWWTLGTQALLIYAPVTVYGYVWLDLGAYLAACLLAVLDRRVAWPLATVVVASSPAGYLALGQPVRSAAWDLAGTLFVLVMLYGPMRLAREATGLREATGQLTRLALARERTRLARDVHDLLGSSLSAIALKADLARRLLPRDRPRAAAELADVAALAGRAAAEARSVVLAGPDTTLARELAAARSVLAAAGIATELDRPPAVGLPEEVDKVLAVVVREAVTNVLRHSTPRQCTIAVEADTATVRVRVANDGRYETGDRAPASPDAPAGSGLENLDARVRACAGRLTAGRRGADGYELVAEIPLAAKPAVSHS